MRQLIKAQAALEQQKEEALAKSEDETLFSTPLSEDESFALYDLQGLIEAIWPPKSTTYQTAFLALDNPHFVRLTKVLEVSYKHPILQAIQNACQETIEILQAKGADPEPDQIFTFNQNMGSLRRLLSEDTFTKLFGAQNS